MLELERSNDSKIVSYLAPNLKPKADAKSAYTEWIVADARPFNIGNTPAFRKFAAAVKFAVPDFRSIKSEMKLRFEAEVKRLREELDPVKNNVSISCDGWLSPSNGELYCVVAHFIDDKWVLQTRLLDIVAMEGHTDSHTIYTKLNEVCTSYSITPVAFVSDGASNIKKAIDLYQKPRIWCVCHLLNLVINDCNDLHVSAPPTGQSNRGAMMYRAV